MATGLHHVISGMHIKQQNGVLHDSGCSGMLTEPSFDSVSGHDKAVVLWHCTLYKGADLCVNQGEKLRLCRVRPSDHEEYEKILHLLLSLVSRDVFGLVR